MLKLKQLTSKIKLSQCWKRISAFCSWDWLVLAVIAAFCWWLMASTFGYRDQTLLIKSRLWSDFAAHLPLIRSFSVGSNLPPEYPQFAGMEIRYHYLFYLLTAGLERLGLNIALALNLLSAFGLGLMLWMVYQLGKLISRKRIVGVLAVMLVLFNSSLTFVDYFQDCSGAASCFWQLLSLKEFVNFGPWNGDVISAFWNWNIYTNQRHLGFSFGLLLVIIWPLLRAGYQRLERLDLKLWLWLVWGGLILLPFFNQAAYVMAVVFIVMWLILNPKLIRSLGSLYFFGLLYSLPSFVYFLGFSSVELELGFLAEADTLMSIGRYWWQNLGAFWLVLPAAIGLSRSQERKLLMIAAVLFVIANSFRLSPDMINNHKLINFMLIISAPVTAKALVKIWTWSVWSKLPAVLTVLALTLSGVVDAMPIINDYQGEVQDYQQTALGRWVVQNTHPDAVFLTSYHMYHPANLAGRKTFLDYGYFAWSLGYPDQERRQVLSEIYAQHTTGRSWCRLMSGLNIDYLTLTPQAKGNGQRLTESWFAREHRPVFAGREHQVYSAAEICD